MLFPYQSLIFILQQFNNYNIYSNLDDLEVIKSHKLLNNLDLYKSFNVLVSKYLRIIKCVIGSV